MRLYFNILLLSAALLSGIASAAAQQNETIEGQQSESAITAPPYEPATLGEALTVDPRAKKSKQPFTQQHELRFSAGLVPLILSLDTYDDPSIYYAYYHRHTNDTFCSYSLSYGYRFKKWLDLSAAFSYCASFYKAYDYADDSLFKRGGEHFLTLMPKVRFTWVNSKWVRMYSSLALGATYNTGDFNDYTGGSSPSIYPAIQISPLGIAVGRSLFGFAELGIGTQGLLQFGLGYRFDVKSTNK